LTGGEAKNAIEVARAWGVGGGGRIFKLQDRRGTGNVVLKCVN